MNTLLIIFFAQYAIGIICGFYATFKNSEGLIEDDYALAGVILSFIPFINLVAVYSLIFESHLK